MHQDYDPCAHGMDSDCCACAIAQLQRQAAADEEEIVLLQQLLANLYRLSTVSDPATQEYLHARGLLKP